jgi:UDP-N-acetylmuramoyl-tripeptide--D-alanyl-D-alanine ligase
MTLFEAFQQTKSISTDTRNITNGSIFFALKGVNFNGNAFAKAALEAGAAYAVIDEPQADLPEAQTFLVDDVLKALQDLAHAYRETFSGIVIGLTGSNGKTTCKELFRDVLSTTYTTNATKGNLNNHIGVPLTLLSIPADTQMVVVEMGANHQKEIELLSSICLPDIGYITNFGKAHLEGFGGIEGVIKGKSELYANLRERGKKAIVHCADSKQLDKSSGIERTTFGDCADADIHITDLKEEMAAARFQGVEIHSLLTGDFHFTNIAAAIALGHLLGVKTEDIKRAIENYSPQMNRTEWRKTAHNEVLMDAYNANPDSMKASIQTFYRLQKPNKWFVLGDMFELGEYSEEEHQRVVDMFGEQHSENVILVGNAFLTTSGLEKAHRFAKTSEALDYLKKQNLHDCTVLLKGSRSMKLETLLEAL